MSGHGEDTAKIARDAYLWLCTAGVAAVCLSIFLATADYRLSHSDKEQKLGATLKELRTAQASQAARVTDDRQLRVSDHNE